MRTRIFPRDGTPVAGAPVGESRGQGIADLKVALGRLLLQQLLLLLFLVGSLLEPIGGLHRKAAGHEGCLVDCRQRLHHGSSNMRIETSLREYGT